MKAIKGCEVVVKTSERMTQLESLVDELIKESPQEDRVRTCMLGAGLEYSSDPIERMENVLSALEGERQNSQNSRNFRNGEKSV
jgi:CO dehydrogenase/acetyl-CoA synthase delta subunit